MWLIGYFISDGYLGMRYDNRGGNNLEKPELRFFDENIKSLEKAVKILSNVFDCNISVMHADKRSKARTICTSKKNVTHFFKNLGFKCGQKVYDVKIPKVIKDQDTLYDMFNKSIQGQYPNHKIYIMSVRCTHDELYKLEYGEEDSMHEQNSHYNIIYLIIPKDLIRNFELNSMCRVAFYVGKSNNQNEYKILDNSPQLNIISTEDKKGRMLPFTYVINLS